MSFLFPSVLTGSRRVVLRCHAFKTIPLRRFLVSAVFRFASATRIRLASRSLAAQLDDVNADSPFAAAASHASPPFFTGDVPLLARELRDLVEFKYSAIRDCALIFRRGVMLRSRSIRIRRRSCGPPSGAGACSAT